MEGWNRVKSRTLKTAAYATRLHASGKGFPILFIHGSGPGADGLSNWRLALPEFGKQFLALVPDLVGFGGSTHPDPPPVGVRAWMRLWVDQLLGLLDELGLERAHLVGNSLGGVIALHLLLEAPERFEKVVLMGPVGAPMRITPELDRLWGFYEDPTVANMKNAIRWFVYEETSISEHLEEIAQMRLEAALRTDSRRSFEAMFPRPRQEQLDQLVVPESALRRIPHPVLLICGRDDRIVPKDTSIWLAERIENAHLFIVGRSSHWVQIERVRVFHRVLWDFFGGEL